MLVGSFLLVSCDTPVRKSGLFIGGKDRRLVELPAAAEPVAPEAPAGGAEAAAPYKEGGKPGAAAPGRAAQQTEIIKGTGRFYDDRARPREVAPGPGGGSVTLNFVDADVRDVIKTVLGSTLGHNFAIDPQVKGTITLQTSKPVPRSAVLSTLESALALNGLALVRTDGLYRVTTSKSAVRNAVRPLLSGMVGTAGEAYGVEIMPLSFASATEMAKIIEPLAPSGAVIRTDTARNLLIVGGTRHERDTIADIVAIFDVDWLSGMSFALVSLEFAQPKEVIADLERVFGTGGGGPLEGLVQFFPVERRQSVLVISAKQDYIDRARDWIRRLDVGGADEKRLYVYSVENGRATDLAAILSQVFSDSGGSAPSRSVAPEQKQARLSTGGSSTGGAPTRSTVSAQAFGAPLSAAQAAPSGAPRGGASVPTRARPTGSSTGSSAVSPAARRRASEGSKLPDELSARIIPDDVNNALVVMARPGVWRMIEEALRKLDVVPLQVMIEATIAEVTLTDELRYGVQSFFQKGSSQAVLSTIAGGTLAAPLAGFSFVYDQGNIQSILDALDSVTDVRVISSPQVLVLDNRTAELQVGDQVPVSTQQSVSNTDPAAPTVNSVELRDTGVVLRVTPRVNASGVVNLEIEQEESSAVQTTSSNIDSPTIQQRKLRSTVVVNSGETVALGGLIRDTQEDGVTGIPLLSSIPILGGLFSATSEKGTRTELLILIRPRVIRNLEEARAVTRDLRKTLKNAAALRKDRR